MTIWAFKKFFPFTSYFFYLLLRRKKNRRSSLSFRLQNFLPLLLRKLFFAICRKTMKEKIINETKCLLHYLFLLHGLLSNSSGKIWLEKKAWKCLNVSNLNWILLYEKIQLTQTIAKPIKFKISQRIQENAIRFH